MRPEQIHSLADQYGKEADELHQQVFPLESRRDALKQCALDLRTAAHSLERVESINQQSSRTGSVSRQPISA